LLPLVLAGGIVTVASANQNNSGTTQGTTGGTR
jgi:hypothetical protein